MSVDPVLAGEAASMRAFNRFYTQKIGVLDDAPLGGPFSLTEGRVLYELAHRDAPAASELCRDLALDRGYLSRILARFQKERLVERSRSPSDGRQSHIRLTPKGADLFASIDSAWQGATEELLAPLAPAARRRLVAAMERIKGLLGDDSEAAAPSAVPIRLRAAAAWRHGLDRAAPCARLWGSSSAGTKNSRRWWRRSSRISARDFDPQRERCWIADRGGEPVGCVFLVKDSDEIGRLRLLFVDPSARGSGAGRRLVEACVKEARRVGYKTLTLYTNDVLVSARRIYEAAGFRLAKEWKHHSFGKDLIGQDWDLTL